MRESGMQEGRRVAALTVHALCPEDQAWLLAQLSPEDRTELSECLSELRALGVPADPQLLSMAKQLAEPSLREAASLPEAASVDVGAASAPSGTRLAQIARCLMDEPLATARLCLAAYDPGEQALLLASMPTERALPLRQEGLVLPATAVELREALRACLMQRAIRSQEVEIHV